MALQLISVIIVFVVFAGLIFRKNKKRHIPLMIAAMVADLGLLLYIELTREAVKRTTEGLPALVWIHISFSLIVVLAYFFQAYAGYQMVRGRKIKWHRVVAVVFVISRLGNLGTGFFVPQSIEKYDAENVSQVREKSSDLYVQNENAVKVTTESPHSINGLRNLSNKTEDSHKSKGDVENETQLSQAR